MRRALRFRQLLVRARAVLTNEPPPPLANRFPEHRFGRGTYGDDLQVRSWGEGAVLSVGSFTSIAAGVQIFLGGEHRSDWVTTFPFSALWPSARHIKGHPKTKGDVTIGSDVWIGTQALIGSGVTVGHGAVIGARSVVTKDVQPYAIVVGNPAKTVKYRFGSHQIDSLLQLAWWDWPDEVIAAAIPDMLDVDIDHFILKAKQGLYAGKRGE